MRHSTESTNYNFHRISCGYIIGLLVNSTDAMLVMYNFMPGFNSSANHRCKPMLTMKLPPSLIHTSNNP